MRRVRIGLLGCGTVGGGFVRLVGSERERLRARFGIDLTIERILVRDARRGEGASWRQPGPPHERRA